MVQRGQSLSPQNANFRAKPVVHAEVTKKNKTVSAFEELHLVAEKEHSNCNIPRDRTGRVLALRCVSSGNTKGEWRVQEERAGEQSTTSGPQKGAWPDPDWGTEGHRQARRMWKEKERNNSRILPRFLDGTFTE